MSVTDGVPCPRRPPQSQPSASHAAWACHSGIDPILTDLIEDFSNKLQLGEQVDVDAYVRANPEYAEQLQRLLPPLRVLAELGSGRGSLWESAFRQHGQASSVATPPEVEGGRLGDFRLLREIGRGGMGVVYEAVQISLGRRVALKVLPFAATLDPKQLQRFKNEAQAAAHLQHQNIVPVHAVGCERGVHFYAMQFVDGQTLAALIHELRQIAGREDRESKIEDRGLRVRRGLKIDDRGSQEGAFGSDSQRTGPFVAQEKSRQTSEERELNGKKAEATVVGLGSETAASRFSILDSPSSFFRRVANLGIQAAEALEHAHQLGVIHRDIKPANLMVEGEPGASATGVRLWITDFGLAHCQGAVELTMSGDLLGTLRYMSPEQALAKRVVVDHRTDIYSLGVTLYELLTLEPVFAGKDRQELLRQIAFEDPKPPGRLNKAIPQELEIIVVKATEKYPADRYATAQELADDLRRFLEDKPIKAKRATSWQKVRRWARRHRPVVWSAAVALLVSLAVLAGCVGWVVRDRAARQAKIAADLRTAWDEALRSQKEGKWPQALAAAKRAEALLHDGAAESALAEQVEGLLGELAQEEADRRLVARLEELRLLQAEVNVKEDRFVLERALPDYRRAFESYGLQVGTMSPEEAAALLRRRPPALRGTLMAALDHWLILARYEKAPEAGWLERVLSTADSDPWRQRLRTARERNDRQALEQLAQQADAAAQPPETLFLLDRALHQRGAKDGAVALLRRAQEIFPGDFWINHDLGMALQDCQPPQYEEAIRYLTVAVALRPDSPGARLNLGLVLYKKGRGGRRRDLDQAAAAFRKAIDLKPDYAMAHQNLGIVLIDQGYLDEAVAAWRRAIALKPDLMEVHYNLGHALYDMGRVDEAVAALRQAAELKPDYADAHYFLGVALRKKGALVEAVAAYRHAIEVKPENAEAHCNLGIVLWQQGEFVQALVPLKRGHELGSRRLDWPYPSAQWLGQCRRLVELDGRLPAVLKGETHLANPAERNEYAQLCYYKKLYVASARFRAGAFTADPKLADDLKAGYRYDAACVAALAAAGQGLDAGQLEDKERLRWRKQALKWLRADLTAYGKQLVSGKPKDHQLVLQRLRHWQGDQNLAELRDPAAVARLPVEEQKVCQQLWADVQALLTKADVAE